MVGCGCGDGSAFKSTHVAVCNPSRGILMPPSDLQEQYMYMIHKHVRKHPYMQNNTTFKHWGWI